MKKTLIATLVSGIVVGCGGGGGGDDEPRQVEVTIDRPTSSTPPSGATRSSDITSGERIPTLTNPNPRPIDTGASRDEKITIETSKTETPEASVPPIAEVTPPVERPDVPAPPIVAAPPAEPPSEFLSRTTVDRPDQSGQSQVHAIYASPFGGVDRNLDTSGRIHIVMDQMNQWMFEQTPGRSFRLDTFQGRLDVTYVQLPRTDEAYTVRGRFKRDAIEEDLMSMGFNVGNKVYVVFYEGGHEQSCADSSNPSFRHGYNVVVMYMQNPCHDMTGYSRLAAVHEVLHAIGAMSPNAPLHSELGHTTDPNDIMYGQFLDPNRSYRLDPSRVNYYNPDGLPSGLWNLAMSPYLKAAGE